MEIEIKATVSQVYKTKNPNNYSIEKLKELFLEEFNDMCVGALITGKIDIEVR